MKNAANNGNYLLLALFFLGSLFFFQSFKTYSEDSSLEDVMTKMNAQTTKLSKLSFTIKNCERIGTKMMCGKQQVSIQLKPFKCRLTTSKPNAGDQIVYNEEQSPKATYIPKGFPYINVNLEPLGTKMMNNNHHSIFELGFVFFTQLINHYYQNNKTSFSIQKVTEGENQYYKVTSSFNDFKYVNYTVRKSENFRNIAHKKFISEYLIAEKNTEKEFYIEGDKLSIPSHYYKKLVLKIDAVNFTPTYIEIFDDKGLLEKYEFSELDTAPKFTEQTFKE